MPTTMSDLVHNRLRTVLILPTMADQLLVVPVTDANVAILVGAAGFALDDAAGAISYAEWMLALPAAGGDTASPAPEPAAPSGGFGVRVAVTVNGEIVVVPMRANLTYNLAEVVVYGAGQTDAAWAYVTAILTATATAADPA